MESNANVERTESESLASLPQDYRDPLDLPQWAEMRLAKGVSLFGRHVVEMIGVERPWDSLGQVAIERFRCAESFAYFIGGEVGAIKIGHSAAPLQRLATMQMGSPIKLKILALAHGGYATERQYHQTFTASRSHGEWFTRTPALEAEIARLQGGVA